MSSREASPSLPMVIATSVIRSSYQGQSHGGVYLVDLAARESRLVLDWNECGISFQGRGGDRGLRGVAFWNGQIYLGASNEIFVYDADFTLLRSFRNAYLRHCHEIFIAGDELFLTSCGFDSILRYDLRAQHFTAGYCVRSGPAIGVTAKGASRALRKLGRSQWNPPPRLQCFDVTSYQPHQLRNGDLPRDHARPAFARGLTLWKDRYVIAGSAPATVSVHDLATGETCCSVNLSMDVRNAIHGLEIWPYPS